MITTTQQLEEFCTRASQSAFVTVDTEFIREKTYWPQLCLIQAADEVGAVAIDPLAPGIDLNPFYELMQNQNVLKVFHAARQDIEIFHHLTGKVPIPLYDTQIAGMVCGFGDSVGYEALVKKFTKATLDKSSRYTDWAQRPLSPKQLDYALGDVIHLRVVYEKLRGSIDRKGRALWLDDEMGILMDPKTYEVDPYRVWEKIRYRTPTRRMLAVLRELAAFREMLAKEKDVPRGRILKDEQLVHLAALAPKTLEDLGRVRQLESRWQQGEGAQKLLRVVEKGRTLPVDECPPLKDHQDSPVGHHALVDILKLLLKLKCDDEDVAPKLIASSSDIDALARGDSDDLKLLHGWRYEIFGKDALALKEGRLAITFQGSKIRFVAV